MTFCIGRREFIAALGGAVAAWPLAVSAQQPRSGTPQMPRSWRSCGVPHIMFVFLGILLALFLPLGGYADSESDVLLKTVAFALTANDGTEVEAVDQRDCVFRINKEIYRLNNVRLDRLRFQDHVRTLKDRKHQVTLVYLSGEAAVQESIYEGLDENNNQLTPEVMQQLKKKLPRRVRGP